jgi:hypothetical protein
MSQGLVTMQSGDYTAHYRFRKSQIYRFPFSFLDANLRLHAVGVAEVDSDDNRWVGDPRMHAGGGVAEFFPKCTTPVKS